MEGGGGEKYFHSTFLRFHAERKGKNAREKIKLHGLISHPIIHCHTLPHGHVELLFWLRDTRTRARVRGWEERECEIYK